MTAQNSSERNKQNPAIILWVRRNLILGVFLLCCIFSAFFLSMEHSYFTATALITFEQTDQDIRTITTSIDPHPHAPQLTDEEKLIRSENVLLPVIRKLNLAQRPEFNPDAEKKKSKAYILGTRLYAMMDLDLPDYTNEAYLQEALNKDLSVTIIDNKNILITYSCISPYLARSVINTLAHVYIRQTDPHSTKKIVSNTKNLPDNAIIPDLPKKIIIALCISALISLLIGFTTPLPKNESHYAS